ncbi:MAG: RlmE family RNA methyltransferase, partial [Victivallales bacterium]|nr:RlmE family RNA methyltransferase [Victivallales bacterium]
DPYVISAKKDGYRSRAAYKLLQLDEKFGLLKKGLAVVDLGAAPGGWTQVLVTALGPRGKVLAVDVIEMDAMGGAQTLVGDVTDLETETAIRAALGGPADLVLSDMAPPATGHRATDHLRIIALAEAALDLAKSVLSPGGGFVAKVWQGGAEQELLAAMKRDFAVVRHAKPEASR